MTDIDHMGEHEWVDKRDLEYIDRERDAGRRKAALSAVTSYRRKDDLDVGDAVPSIELVQLDTNDTINFASDRDQPLMLIFGSYT